MAEDKGFWRTVGDAFTDRFKNLIAPEKSEVEIAAKKKAAEVKALQCAEDAVKNFSAASDEQWAAVDKAKERYKS